MAKMNRMNASVKRTADGDVHPDEIRAALLALQPHAGYLINVAISAIESNIDEIEKSIMQDAFFKRDTEQHRRERGYDWRLERDNKILASLNVLKEANMEQEATAMAEAMADVLRAEKGKAK